MAIGKVVQQQDKPQKHSTLGIISLLLALTGFVFLYLYSENIGMDNPSSYMNAMIITAISLSLLGLILAIAGLFMKKRKNHFAFVGVIANIVLLAAPFVFYFLLYVNRLGEVSSPN